MENPSFHRIIGLNEESTLPDPTLEEIEAQIRRLNPTNTQFRYYLLCGILEIIHVNPMRVHVFFEGTPAFRKVNELPEWDIILVDRHYLNNDNLVKLFDDQGVDEICFFQTVEIDHAIAVTLAMRENNTLPIGSIWHIQEHSFMDVGELETTFRWIMKEDKP